MLFRSDDDIDIVYLDKGGKGAVYKIEGLKGWTSSKVDKKYEEPDEFVIKVYHEVKGDRWHPFKSHGAYAEINSANYWTKQEGRYTQRGKFFFAGLKSGYMVNKFLDEDTRLPKRIIDEYSRGIKCTDEDKYVLHKDIIEGYNRIKGYNYDWGGALVKGGEEEACLRRRDDPVRLQVVEGIFIDKVAQGGLGQLHREIGRASCRERV